MIRRYTRPEMGAVWSDEAKYAGWLAVELAVCEAHARHGVIPADAPGRIRSRARVDAARIEAIEARVRHDVIAFLTDLEAAIGDDSRFVHVGLTSSDVVDTALALQLVAAADRLVARARPAPGGSPHARPSPPRHRDGGAHPRRARRADHVRLEGRRVVDRGRAEPRAAAPGPGGRAGREDLRRGRELRPRRARDRGRGVPGPGARAGARLDPDRPARPPCRVRHDVCDRRRQPGAHRHGDPEPPAHRGTWRLEEPFAEGRRASAMPHKRNPVLPSRCGLARVPRANAGAALEDEALWHERDISHSSVDALSCPTPRSSSTTCSPR